MNKQSIHRGIDYFIRQIKEETRSSETRGMDESVLSILLNIRDDYDSTIRSILQEVVGEEKMMREYYGASTNVEIEQSAGYNIKRQEIIDTIKRMGYGDNPS